MITSFELLDPKIQKIIYKLGWERFKPIQDEAIAHLMQTPSDLIISAPTSSGKTEAAFLPIISLVAESANTALKILYISPLKALINDQFRRIEELCSNLEFPITKWHGDASQSKKTRLLKNPCGILLITPESIEALFLNKSEKLPLLFSQLEYVVIDEIHSFVENERGTQLKSLLNRIEEAADIHPIKIGLSATLNNPDALKDWLNHDNPNSVIIIEDTTTDKITRGAIKVFYEKDDEDKKVESAQSDDVNKEQSHGLPEYQPSEFDSALFNIISKDKNLIFANSKVSLELNCDNMQMLSKKMHYPNIFYIHHGSLAKELRELTELDLKTHQNISVFCTNTLELGIDIGNINRIVFLFPPFSVSSLIQRLGRSGRKEGEAREFQFVLEVPKINPDTQLQDALRLSLIQSIAMVELMLEGWCEPMNTHAKDYSTFIHQILSYLGQTGGKKASDIYQAIALKAFQGQFDKQEFMKILRKLNEDGIIYSLPDEVLTLGNNGEKIVENYKFYAAFITSDEWKIVANGKEIGRLDKSDIRAIEVESVFLLAGKRWKVVSINEKSSTILVVRTEQKKLLSFHGNGQSIHKKIHEKMLEIYEQRYIPRYLAKASTPILMESFEQYEINIELEDGNILKTFAGTRVQNTLDILLHWMKVKAENLDIGFYSPNGESYIRDKLKSIDFDSVDFNEILNSMSRVFKETRKYDKYLPDDLLNQSYIQLNMDIEGAKEFCNNLE